MNAIIQHSHDSVEWVSPSYIVDSSRALMGGIDLDPASSPAANELVVHATDYFTRLSDGFRRRWHGRVWLNPPGGFCDKFGQEVIRAKGSVPDCKVTGACGLPPGHEHLGVESAAKAWWRRLVDEYDEGRVEQACFLGFNSEILRSTQGEGDLACLSFPCCYPKSRIPFSKLKPFSESEPTDGTYTLVKGAAPPHDSVVVYLPPKRAPGELKGRIARLVAYADDLDRMIEHFGDVGRCK